MSDCVLDVWDLNASVLLPLMVIVQDMASLQPIFVGTFFDQCDQKVTSTGKADVTFCTAAEVSDSLDFYFLVYTVGTSRHS